MEVRKRMERSGILNRIRRLKVSKIKGFLYELRPECLIPVEASLKAKIEIRPIKAGRDVEQLREIQVKNAFEKMEKNGQICIGAYVNGKLAGHAACILPEMEYGPFIVKESAYIHYCYVDPEWRGFGIYPNMLSWIVKMVLDKYDISRVTITTTEENVASQNGLKKIGFRFARKYTYIEWWRIIWKKIVV